MAHEKLREKIFKYAVRGLMNIMNISKEEALKMVEESTLEESIKREPVLIGHCDEEMLADMVLGNC